MRQSKKQKSDEEKVYENHKKKLQNKSKNQDKKFINI